MQQREPHGLPTLFLTPTGRVGLVGVNLEGSRSFVPEGECVVLACCESPDKGGAISCRGNRS